MTDELYDLIDRIQAGYTELDGRWVPMLVAETATINLTGTLPRARELETAIAMTAATLAHLQAPRRVTVILPATMNHNPAVQPSQDPNASEALIVLSITPLGVESIAAPYGREVDGSIYWKDRHPMVSVALAPWLEVLRAIFDSNAPSWPDIKVAKIMASLGANITIEDA